MIAIAMRLIDPQSNNIASWQNRNTKYLFAKTSTTLAKSRIKERAVYFNVDVGAPHTAWSGVYEIFDDR